MTDERDVEAREAEAVVIDDTITVERLVAECGFTPLLGMAILYLPMDRRLEMVDRLMLRDGDVCVEYPGVRTMSDVHTLLRFMGVDG